MEIKNDLMMLVFIGKYWFLQKSSWIIILGDSWLMTLGGWTTSAEISYQMQSKTFMTFLLLHLSGSLSGHCADFRLNDTLTDINLIFRLLSRIKRTLFRTWTQRAGRKRQPSGMEYLIKLIMSAYLYSPMNSELCKLSETAVYFDKFSN